MARGIQGAVLRGFGARDHQATVVQTSQIAPHFVRVEMSSPTLFEDAAVEPTAWLRFWFPDPAGSETEFQRSYTIVWADPQTGGFAVDVVLHEPAGPACAWMAHAQPGMTLPVMSFGSSKFTVPQELPAGFLLIGDPASIPAINSILAALPADVDVELYLEQHRIEDELIPIADHPRRKLHRVQRIDEASLAAAIEERDWSDWYAWLAGEAGSLKHLRKRLRDTFGFPKADMYAQAYWTYGRAMGSRRGPREPMETGRHLPAPIELTLTESEPNSAEGQPVSHDLARTDETRTTSAGDHSPARGQWRSQAGRDLLGQVKPQLIASGVLQALITLVQLAPFVVLVELARRLLGGAAAQTLWSTGMVFLMLLGIGSVLGAGLTLWLHVVDSRFSADVRRRLLGKLARVPLGWFTQHGSGAVKKLVQDDTLSLHYLVTHAVPDAVGAVVAPLAVLAYLFVVDWRMVLILLIPIVVYVVTTSLMMMQTGPKIAEASRWSERMNTESAAYLEGQPVIRVFGGVAASSFRRRLDDYLDFLNGWQRPLTGKKTFMDLVTRPTTFLWLICAAGTAFIVTGAMQPQTLLPFLLLGTTFGARLLGVAYGVGGLRDGMQAARRIAIALSEVELTTPGPERGGGHIPATAVTDDRRAERSPSGTVCFDRVGFGYRPGVPVIHDVSFTMRPATVTALVGPSGSGKSTLAALLARFHDVDSGSIHIDGHDIRSLTTDELYTRVGFVFQDAQLVAGSVRDNIALARPDAGIAEVVAAAQDAQLHERIQRLPDGYDTVLGPNSKLSGGERQRLTIARALLADTPILILDEATAFADPESEYLVQQALGRLTRNRTVLVIAHRLYTITQADQIIVLDHGRIVERGTHPQLLSAGGRYRQLWDGRVTETASVTGETAR